MSPPPPTQHPFRFLLRLTGAVTLACAHAGGGEVPLPLSAALERMTSTDRTVAMADAEVRKAITERLRAGLRLKPSVSADASAGIRGSRTRMEVETLPDLIRERRWVHSDGDSESVGLNLSQPILDLTVRPAQRQSELLSAIAQWQLRQRLREVLFEVTAQYIEVLRQSQLVEENKKTLTQTAEQVRFAEGRFLAQEVIESDVLQAKVSDEQARRAVMARGDARL
jgi:outer membrane protein TolC